MPPEPEIIEASQVLAREAGLLHAAREPFVRLGYAPADAALSGGLKRDALHEVFAASTGEEAAATGFALALAARMSIKYKWLLWVQQDFSALEGGELHGSGLPEFGIDPSRLLLVRAPDAIAALRAGLEGLACKGLSAAIVEVWGEPKALDLVASRKLTLMAQRYAVAAILLRSGAVPKPSTAETRWLVRAEASSLGDEDWSRPRFDTALVRNRQGRTGHWIMEWDCHGRIFRESAAHPRASASAPSDRPAYAPLEGFRQAG